MNLFLLNKCSQKNAIQHCNRHVVKMILELTQLLYSAWWMSKEDSEIWSTKVPNNKPYKASHIFHPIAMWVRKTKKNYNFVVNLALELCKEYTHRYTKIHACQKHLFALQKLNFPEPVFPQPKPKKSKPHIIATINLPEEIDDFPLCMPETCYVKKDTEFDAIESYRKYYLTKGSEKWMLKWKNRDIPLWYKEMKMLKKDYYGGDKSFETIDFRKCAPKGYEFNKPSLTFL
mgnify:CR=1 FL=1